MKSFFILQQSEQIGSLKYLSLKATLLWHVSQGCINSVTLHPMIYITEEMQRSEFNHIVSTRNRGRGSQEDVWSDKPERWRSQVPSLFPCLSLPWFLTPSTQDSSLPGTPDGSLLQADTCSLFCILVYVRILNFLLSLESVLLLETIFVTKGR